MKTPNSNLKELENKMKGKYLTEEWLGKILKALYPNCRWIHDERFKLKGKTYNFRPDYCCHELKKCVEFDGPDHFTRANVIQADIKKDKVLSELGYEVIRIPYFIQLDKEAIKFFFDLEVDFNYDFKQGFISNNIVLPASFCEQGVWKFKNFLFKLSQAEKGKICENVFIKIKESLLNKIKSLKLSKETAMITVVPSQLYLTLGLSDYNYENIISESGKIQCVNEATSNLQNNWNCTILTSAQHLLDQEVYDIHFSYNSKGNLSGYSFKMLHDSEVAKYTLLVEENSEDESVVNISEYINGQLVYRDCSKKFKVNHFSILLYLFP